MSGIGNIEKVGGSGNGNVGTGIEVRVHCPGDDVSDFVEAGREMFRGDPAWMGHGPRPARGGRQGRAGPEAGPRSGSRFIAEVDGEPMGMCIMLPNLNEAIADLGGKLLPFGAAKLVWRLKVKHPRSTRLMMLGLKGNVRRNVRRYGGLSAAMYVEVANGGIDEGYTWGELSWTREGDKPIDLDVRSMGAKPYKKYRLYSKPL